MTNREMHKILQSVYELDNQTEEWLDCWEKAKTEGNQEKMTICEKQHLCLTFKMTGMMETISALGYKLTDDDGFWKIIPIT